MLLIWANFSYFEKANSNCNYAIHNNQTTQNQPLIFNTIINENEKCQRPIKSKKI